MNLHEAKFVAFAILMFAVIGVPASEPSVISISQKNHPKPNELGLVMVIMYHQIGPNESTWRRTPKGFEEDLQALYDKGYRPLSLVDFVKNNITTPSGLSPVVISFDDGTMGQFRVDKNNRIDPRSAVGIMEEFHKKHPDFSLEATFFLHGKRPFGQSDSVSYKMNYLLSKGFDIGNHTTKHHDLSRPEMQNSIKIQSVIGNQAQYLEKKITQHPTYKVNTLALCFGQRPTRPFLRRYLESGVSKSINYNNIAVLNVGSGPSKSPFDKRFLPYSIPRIRASVKNTGNTGLYNWLTYFDRHENRRFISDGDPHTISIPETMKDYLDKNKLNNLNTKYVD